MILRWGVSLLVVSVAAQESKEILSAMETFSSKSCKYNPIPSYVDTRAFTSFTGEVNVNDVFGLPASVKRHILRLNVGTAALLTLQAEVHRDTPSTLTVDAYRRGDHTPAGRVLVGQNLLGCGGDDTKALLHGMLGDKDLEIDIVFERISIQVASAQVDSRGAEARCWPIRLDVAAVPTARAAFHWPVACLAENRLPPGLLTGSSGLNKMATLGNEGFLLSPPTASDRHYVYRFGDERPWTGFQRSIWNGVFEAPPRLHRFVRIFMRTSFRFSSSPLQLVIELFDLKTTPGSSDLAPICAMGCLGGVPVFNGQVIDHAMPVGFRYRLWLLAAGMAEWTSVIRSPDRHCLEFDFDYTIRFEQRLTPFEVGPAAWLCESSRLPSKILQTPLQLSTEKLESKETLVAGRTLWIRDKFGFPPNEVADMEHSIEVEVGERCIFRATTHHSEGVDVFIALTRKGSTERACASLKHPGPVPRQTIFCLLEPGVYTLTFFADYPLGGLHPCSDFFAQIGIRPVALANEHKNKECIEAASDLTSLQVDHSGALTTTPRWKSIKVPITFENSATTVSVWSQSITITEEQAAQKKFLRLVVHSDYVSSDIRFQVRLSGRYIADTQVTAHGYADMIGPLEPGTYYVDMYYVTGTRGDKNFKLCSASTVDLRIVSQENYQGTDSAQWLCTSSRVPPPDRLFPLPDEQVLLDSEYVVPESGVHKLQLKVEEVRFVRIKLESADEDFAIEMWTRGASESLLLRGTDSLEIVLTKGTFTLVLKAVKAGTEQFKTCATFYLNLLLVPQQSVPVCPWAPSSSDQTAIARAQKQATDHIGDLLLDLVPKQVSKDLVPKKPATLWMSPGMSKTFDLTVQTTSAVRIEVSIQPPFIPLEIDITRKRRALVRMAETPVAAAEWTESRLLLMKSDLLKGDYEISFKQPRQYTLQAGSGLSSDTIANACAHVTIHTEVAEASDEAINKLRSEMLDIPDLLAVQPTPASLNAVGWFGSDFLSVVGTQVYRFSETTSKIPFKVDSKVIVRVVSEPADLSNSQIRTQLLQNSTPVSSSDELGQLLAMVPAGSYELALTPSGKAPFLVTVGIATENRLKDDLLLQDSGKACTPKLPNFADTATFPARGWTIGPHFVRLSQTMTTVEGTIGTIPVQLKAPSVIYIEAGSSLPLDLIRIALKVPEGLWVGEQRGTRNSLQLELPAGSYEVQLSQPKTLHMSDIPRCLDFSFKIMVSPVNAGFGEVSPVSPGVSDGVKRAPELTTAEEAHVEVAPCFIMGAVPLPLDFTDPKGGSTMMGGPMDKNGRMLIRTRALLTDMHDGRKKVFLQTGGKKLQIKVGIVLGGHARYSLASNLEFTVAQLGNGPPVDPVESWSTPEGWERIYIVDRSGFWLSFHHNHRSRTESACLHFGLQLEVHPVEDVPRMMDCPSDAKSAEDMFPSRLGVGQSDLTRTIYRWTQPTSFVRESPEGFMREVRFELATPSHVVVEVGHNFFSSHAEMDVIEDEGLTLPVALAFADRDFLHKPSDPLNTMLKIGHTFDPGRYVIRIADDHYASQFSNSQSCFPFSFDFRVVPIKVDNPTIVSLSPHPSVPVVRGVDLVFTLRFSEPPAGTMEDVVKAISFGGVQATMGGSRNMLDQRFSSTKRATVQASTAENHLVWVIGWDAQALPSTTEARFKIGPLRGNTSAISFRFNPPVYTIVDEPQGIPWSGSTTTSSVAFAGTGSANIPQGFSNGIGELRLEGGGVPPNNGHEDIGRLRINGQLPSVIGTKTGEIHIEGSKSAQLDQDESDAPRVTVQEWKMADGSVSPSATTMSNLPGSAFNNYAPMDAASGGDCPDGSIRNAASGACGNSQSARDSTTPVAHRSITMLCVFALIGVMCFYVVPQMRGVAPRPSRHDERFKVRSAEEEEIGMVHAIGRGVDDDEHDML